MPKILPKMAVIMLTAAPSQQYARLWKAIICFTVLEIIGLVESSFSPAHPSDVAQAEGNVKQPCAESDLRAAAGQVP